MLKYTRYLLLVFALVPLAGWSAPAPSKAEADIKARFAKAVGLQQAGKIDAAAAEYRAILKLQPNTVAALGNLGIIYLQKGQIGNAEAAFTRVLAVDAKNEFALQQLIRISLGTNKSRQALKYARKFLKLKPKDYNARFMFGVASLEAGDYQAAVDSFKMAAHAKPDDKSALYNLAYSYINMKKYDAASEIAERLAKLDPENPQVRMVAGFAAEQTGDKAAAIKHYEAASKNPGAARAALMNLARVYSMSKNVEKSMETLKRLLKIDKNNYQANFNLGRMQYSKNQFKEAEVSFLAARKLNPKDAGAAVNLALVQSRLQKTDAAKNTIRAALKLDPKNKMALEVYGFVLENDRKFDDAIAAYRKWEKYYPKDAQPNRKIATDYQLQGKKDKAYAEYEIALKKAPKDIDLINSYAQALSRNLDYAKACTMYEKSMKLKPGVVETMVDAAMCLQRQSKPDDAAALLKKAIAASPKQEPAYLALADVYKGQDKTDLAIEEYKKVLEFSPKSMSVLMSLAEAYDSQKNYEAEIGIYRKLREAEPKETYYATAIPKIYEKWEKLDQAVEEARKLVESDPKEQSYRVTLAGLLDKKGDYTGALEQYTELTKSESPGTKAYAYDQIGGVQQKMEKTDDAIASYKKAIEIRPDYTKSLESLSKIYENQKKSEEFCAYLNTLMDSGKQDLPYKYYFDTFKKAKKADEAVKKLEDLSAKSPDNKQLTMVLGAAYAGVDQKDKAIEQYKKVLTKQKDDPWANRELGDLYKSMGRNQEAADCLAIAAKMFSFDRKLMLDLGDLYEKLGKKADALKTYKDCLQSDSTNQEIKDKIQALEGGKPTPPSEPAKPAEPAK